LPASENFKAISYTAVLNPTVADAGAF